MKSFSIPSVFFKLGALAGIISAILMVMGFFLHPADQDPVNVTEPQWIPAHALLWISFVLSLVEWTSLYIVQASKAGILGTIAFVVLIIGTCAVTWIFGTEATFIPIVTAQSPELFRNIFAGANMLLAAAIGIIWFGGIILFAVSIIKAMVFNKSTGYLVAIGTFLMPLGYLAGFSIKSAAVGAALSATGQVWLCYEMLKLNKRKESSKKIELIVAVTHQGEVGEA